MLRRGDRAAQQRPPQRSMPGSHELRDGVRVRGHVSRTRLLRPGVRACPAQTGLAYARTRAGGVVQGLPDPHLPRRFTPAHPRDLLHEGHRAAMSPRLRQPRMPRLTRGPPRENAGGDHPQSLRELPHRGCQFQQLHRARIIQPLHHRRQRPGIGHVTGQGADGRDLVRDAGEK